MCKFCEGSDRKFSGKFAIYMTVWGDDNKTLSIQYDGMDEAGETDFKINYCPICGKKIVKVNECTELTEALETLKNNGYICESNKHFELWQYKLAVKKELNKWLKIDKHWKSFDDLRSSINWECYVDIVDRMKEYFKFGKTVEECVENIKEMADDAYKRGS